MTIRSCVIWLLLITPYLCLKTFLCFLICFFPVQHAKFLLLSLCSFSFVKMTILPQSSEAPHIHVSAQKSLPPRVLSHDFTWNISFSIPSDCFSFIPLILNDDIVGVYVCIHSHFSILEYILGLLQVLESLVFFQTLL